MEVFFWNKPIFILGNPRSGTSLLRLMLDSHNDICIPPESHFFLWLESKFGRWDMNHMDAYLEDLFNATKFETWNLDKSALKEFLVARDIKSYAQLNSLVYYYYAITKKRQITFWGDKNSLWVDKLPQIIKHYPDAFFIHIIRDGRDIACSYKALNSKKMDSKYAPKLPNNVKEIAEKWSNSVEGIEGFLQKIDSNKKVQIYYEDLLSAPKVTLQKVLDILNLEFLEAQTKYYLKKKNDIEPEAFFAWKEKLTQPLDNSNVGKYKKELTVNEINDFNRLAETTLLKHGYL
tara:strand:- start:142790 stop:143659 length:870 start_codon:yes stop_codon:yes gene_type:complete